MVQTPIENHGMQLEESFKGGRIVGFVDCAGGEGNIDI